jgi:fimbrial chaperone protein
MSMLPGLGRAGRTAGRALAALVGAVLIVGLFAVSSDAMRVSPMVSEITTRGAGSSTRIEVQNIGAAALPYETRITRIDFDAEGKLIETAADEDFLVFPPQGVVPVGGRQVVRVQWVGDPDLDVSRAYYVGVRQLPVEVEERPDGSAGMQVQVVYHMKSLVTVAPPGVEADVSVVSVRPTQVSAEAPAPQIDPALTGGQPVAVEPPAEVLAPGIEVKVRNTGRRYALMSGAVWVVEGVSETGERTEIRLDPAVVNVAVGVGYLAPVNGERTFRVPTGVAFAADQPVRVRFTR